MRTIKRDRSAYMRERYLADPGKVRTAAQEYYRKNKQSCLRRAKRWRLKNKERVAASNRVNGARWYRDNLARVKKNRWAWHLRQYGLTVEQFDAMVIDQLGLCEICGAADKRLCIDHDHRTNAVRGLLCNTCNLAMGYFEKIRHLTDRFEKYLEQN